MDVCHAPGNGRPACIHADDLEGIRDRLAGHDEQLGAVAGELARCRTAAERSADAAIEAAAGMKSFVAQNAAEHERIFGRLAEMRMTSVADYDCGPDTSVDVAAGNVGGLQARLMAERERAARAEAALAERDRVSRIRLEGWKLVVTVIVAIVGAGGGLAALAQAVVK